MTAARHVVALSPRLRAVPAPRRAAAPRPLVVVPAHDEARSLPGVLADLRAFCPGAPVLVVDDGSGDGTWRVAEAHGAAWLRFDARLGVGGAMTAGFRYAARHGCAPVVRVDGDGQHAAGDAAALLERLERDAVDVVLGSRYAFGRRRDGSVPRQLAQALLASLLSWLTSERVTDPTCGCAAFGQRAVDLLAEHHPSGYPEPELHLLFRRSGLRVVEHPIQARARTAGHSTLTTARLWGAAARVALAMVVVPLRSHPADSPRA